MYRRTTLRHEGDSLRARTVRRVLFHVASTPCRVMPIQNASSPLVNFCDERRIANDLVMSKMGFCKDILIFSEDNGRR